MKGDADPHRLVILGQHLTPEQRRHQCSDPLLAVDQDALAGRGRTIFETHLWVAPCDQIADWIPLVERVEQIADLGRIPDEWSLNFRNRYLAGFDECQQGLDGMRRDGVALYSHYRSLSRNFQLVYAYCRAVMEAKTEAQAMRGAMESGQLLPIHP
jgi:hypothetical protein